MLWQNALDVHFAEAGRLRALQVVFKADGGDARDIEIEHQLESVKFVCPTVLNCTEVDFFRVFPAEGGRDGL